MVQAAVARDLQEPRARGGLAAEAIEGGECAREGVLAEVLGEPAVANHRAAQGEDRRRVLLHQQRGGPAAIAARDQTS